MYSHGPSYKTRPVNLPDPYETKFTAKTANDTAQIRGRRGFVSILAKAIPGWTDHPGSRKCEFIHQRQATAKN